MGTEVQYQVQVYSYVAFFVLSFGFKSTSEKKINQCFDRKNAERTIDHEDNGISRQ